MSNQTNDGGIRGLLNQNPLPVIAGLVILIALVLYFLVGNPFSNARDRPPGYFSNDNGATFYEDSMDNIPPFDGGEGLGAMVVRDGKDGTPYVKYVWKYRNQDLVDAAAAADAENRRRPPRGILYRAPGATEWIDGDNPSDPAALAELRELRNAEGKPLTIVNP